jgi:type VII secretion EssC-like protein
MPEFMNRPPRIQPELPAGDRPIPRPPGEDTTGLQALLQVGVPLLTIAGYILIAATGQGRNLLLIIPMAMSVIASTSLGAFAYFRNLRVAREKQRAYMQQLSDMRRDMLQAHDEQRSFYKYNFPDPDMAVRIASGKEGSRFGSRLWERRSSDADFGMLRLGMGTRPSTVTYTVTDLEAGFSPLMREATRLMEDSQHVSDIPLTVALRPGYRERSETHDPQKEARHTIGIAGSRKNEVYDYVRSLVVHHTVFHAPSDARLFVIGAPEAKPQWDWARWLPHANTSRNQSGAGDQLCFEARDVRRLWDNLQSELERRQLRLADDKTTVDVTLPFLLVIVDALTERDEDSPLQEVQAEAAVSLLMQNGPELGAAILFIVPRVELIPSECRAVIEIESMQSQLAMRYAETGVNSPRYVGVADRIDASRAEHDLARKLAPLAVRTTYGADLAMAVSLLEMNEAVSVDEIPVMDYWRSSRKPENSEWLRVPIGVMPGNKVRELVFAADGDGVHGMIAGTTGSGKSELLLTLITGLAIRYDPSVINFVLVDYKGGAAFDPFRTLPHCVDIVTNLQGTAGIRTFTALRSELNRRSKLIADTNVKHIVHYRQKGLHLTREPFPFLFVIVDEFAEMVKENPEFKAQLDSITRLGRALGVSLILATQRPAGAVTDQMRANMKFRICLRVETTEDSRELLRRSDAAFLPPNIPGRAYLQVGNENIELMQVARAGGPYTGPQVDSSPAVIWLNRQHIISSSRPEGALQEAPALSDVIVEVTHRFAEENSDVDKQKKPWPDPLPEALPLDAAYIGGETERNPLLPLNPLLIDWLEGEGSWRGVDWQDGALRAAVGLIDNPIRAEQLTLTVDLMRGHTVIFGASGYGKTTFLRTLILSLTVVHSPAELHIYALDFGGRGLDVLLDLPHFGASILPAEEERVQRLLRRLSNTLEERRDALSQARADNLASYNASHPESLLPAILVVIDNFAEFRENYESQMETLISLARDGRAYGIHFVITGEQPGALPGKLYNLITERLTLKLADASDYSNIVGRGVPGITDVPGRGFVSIERSPLELQVALPVSISPEDEAEGIEDADKLAALASAMRAAWTGARPQGIDILRPIIPLKSLQPAPGRGASRFEPIIGVEDLDLQPAAIEIQQKGPHFLIIGPPLCGKTTTVRSWIMSLAHSYAPSQAALVLIDFQQRLFKYGGAHTLADLPHVLATVSDQEGLTAMIERLQFEYSAERPAAPARPEIFILADNYDDFATVIGSSTSTKSTVYKDMGALARTYGTEGLHFVLCGSMAIMRSPDELMRQVTANRYGLGLDTGEAPQALGGRVRSNAAADFPPGRGYVVKSGRISLIQVALPQHEGTMEESLDQWVGEIAGQYTERARWAKDLLPPPEPVEATATEQPAK